jgi:hypothetical protein
MAIAGKGGGSLSAKSLQIATSIPGVYEENTRFTPSPKSILSQTPKKASSNTHITLDLPITPPFRKTSLYLTKPYSEDPRLSVDTLLTSPQSSEADDGERRDLLLGSSRKLRLRRQGEGKQGSTIVLVEDTRAADMQAELGKTRKTLEEKEREIGEMRAVIREMEGKMKAEREVLNEVKSDRELLLAKLKRVEGDLQDKFTAEIQRLTSLLTESSRRFKDASKAVSSPTSASSNSSAFCAYLLEENHRISEELAHVKVNFQQDYTGLMSALDGELAHIHFDISKLCTLLRCVKKGEQVQLELLWDRGRGEEKERRGSYAEECMKEMKGIKTCVEEMKNIAADFYAEQCSQLCMPQ